MALHKDITGADLHEPKGVATATSGQVYQADGVGSGTWSTLTIPSGTFKITIGDFTSSGTWTKPANLFGIVFHIVSNGASNTAQTTSIGTLAVVNGATTAATAHDGTLGTTPSGAKGFVGNASQTNDVYVNGVFTYTAAPGPFNGIKKGWGTAVGTVGNGSGAYMYGWIPAASLGATETITIGTSNIAGTDGYCLIEQYITV